MQGHAKDIQKAAEQLALATQVRDASAAQASGRGSVPPTTQPGFNTQPQIPGSGPGPVSQPALSYPAGPYNLPLPASLPGPSAAFPAAVSLQGHMPVPELPQAPVQAQLGAQAPSQQLFSGFPGQMSQQLLSFPMPGIPGPLTFTGPLPGECPSLCLQVLSVAPWRVLGVGVGSQYLGVSASHLAGGLAGRCSPGACLICDASVSCPMHNGQNLWQLLWNAPG